MRFARPCAFLGPACRAQNGPEFGQIGCYTRFVVKWNRDKRERVAWIESNAALLEPLAAIFGALTVILVLSGHWDLGIGNRFLRFTLAMISALWLPRVASGIEAAFYRLVTHNPLRQQGAWDRAIQLGENEGVTTLLVGNSHRRVGGRDWVLLRFAERARAAEFLKDKLTPSETEIPSGENVRLAWLRESFRVLATLSISGYFVNIRYFDSTMKPHFGISALFLAGFVLVLTLHRFVQKSVSPSFYRAIVETLTERQAISEPQHRLPARGPGESYGTWLSRLSKLLTTAGDNAYRGPAALQTSDLEATVEHGTEDERLAAAWLLGKVRIAPNDEPDVAHAMQRIATAETAEDAEQAMLELPPGALRRKRS